MYKILVVDDEEKIREVIKEYGEFEGYSVSEASDGMEAVNICKYENFDIIIMDIMMPKLDGYSAVKEIRKTKNTPVLMLSARGEEYDKLFGFEIGIDDYVVKPFSPREVMARIKAILNRNQAKLGGNKKVSFESLVIDFEGRNVYVDDKKVDMTPKEYDLIFYMVRNKNIALSREKLLDEVWGYDFIGDVRTVDVTVRRLREKIEDDPGNPAYLCTKRGAGYFLRRPD